MQRFVPPALRSLVAGARGRDKTQLVWAAAVLMLLAQLVFRAWALYPSWFYADDYVLLIEGESRASPDLGYLFTPFNSHVMPLGRLLVWLVAHAGTTSWALTVTTTLVLQAAASVAGVWMLHTLFGARWAILPLLGLYLSSAMAMPGLMWWAAALNQLPLQLAIFAAVGCWVRHLRGDGTRWLVGASAALVFGLLWDVRAMLIVPLLVFVLLAYFTTGSLKNRVFDGFRQYPRAVATGLILSVAYTAYYAASVPPPFEKSSGNRITTALEIADSMLGTALPTAMLGGPWRWFDTTPPIVLAGAPDWAVNASWLLIALVVAFSLLRRRQSGRAWTLILGYGVALWLLLAVSRGQIYGALAGLEYRYLTDMVCIVPLGVGLAFLPVSGASGSSTVRLDPALRLSPSRATVSAVVALICLGGTISSWRYVSFWHEDNASRAYVKTAQRDLRDVQGSVDLPDQVLLPEVMPGYTTPDNRTEQFLPLITDNTRFPKVTDNLQVLDADGSLHGALIKASFQAPSGRSPSCGTRVSSDPVSFPLNATTFRWPWWVRIGYLSSASSPVTVTTGDSTVQTRVRKGLHSLYVQSSAIFDTVEISGLSPGTLMCVDTVEVGDPVPELTPR